MFGNNLGMTELRSIEILKSFDPRGSKVVQAVHKGLNLALELIFFIPIRSGLIAMQKPCSCIALGAAHWSELR